MHWFNNTAHCIRPPDSVVAASLAAMGILHFWPPDWLWGHLQRDAQLTCAVSNKFPWIPGHGFSVFIYCLIVLYVQELCSKFCWSILNVKKNYKAIPELFEHPVCLVLSKYINKLNKTLLKLIIKPVTVWWGCLPYQPVSCVNYVFVS